MKHIYANLLVSRHLHDPGRFRPQCEIKCCEVVMPNITIIFSNQISAVPKKSELCRAEQKIICNITQSIKDTDFHFDSL